MAPSRGREIPSHLSDLVPVNGLVPVHGLVPAARSSGRADGRFADEALAILMAYVAAACTRPDEYEAKIFGAGNQFSASSTAATIEIPQRNIEVGFDLLARHGFHVDAMDLGGNGPRQVVLDLSCGEVWVQHHDNVGDGEP